MLCLSICINKPIQSSRLLDGVVPSASIFTGEKLSPRGVKPFGPTIVGVELGFRPRLSPDLPS